jgi:hypothetical protein
MSEEKNPQVLMETSKGNITIELFKEKAPISVRNFLSYGVVGTMMWAGLGDVVNAFRERTLGLPPLDLVHGASLLEDSEVPFTYLFPESLVPRPPDFGSHVDMANFVFWDQADGYEPPPAAFNLGPNFLP